MRASSTAKDTVQEQLAAYTQIQSLHRGRQQRKELATQHLAAIKIQAVVRRGKAARSRSSFN